MLTLPPESLSEICVVVVWMLMLPAGVSSSVMCGRRRSRP